MHAQLTALGPNMDFNLARKSPKIFCIYIYICLIADPVERLKLWALGYLKNLGQSFQPFSSRGTSLQHFQGT